MTEIARFTRDLLTRHGAIVEVRGDGLEVVAGQGLAAELGLAEYQRLVFAPGDTGYEPATSIRVDYDSPLVDRMGTVTDRLGRVAVVRGPTVALKTIDGAAQVDRALTLQNGVYRIVSAAPATATCVGVVFEYEILADEREGGLMTVWVSPATRSIPQFDSPLQSDDWQDLPSPEASAGDFAVPWPMAVAAARSRLTLPLAGFLDSLTRRRERDARRLREYALDIDQAIRDKLARHTIGEATRHRERDRLDATSRSYRTRLADLVERYRVRVRLLPRGVIATTVPVHHIQVRLVRRTAASEVILAWNPIDGRLETRCCDGCDAPTSAAWLCDDRVHFLCDTCFAACKVCGKPFCRACHRACPKRH